MNLKNNPFTKIDALENLVNLTNLDISKNSETVDENKIADISKLSSLNALTDLRVDYNKIEDIAALSSMRNLKRLNVAYNKIKNLDALKSLDKLVSVYASGNEEVSDIKGLSNISGIQEVQCGNCAVDDIKYSEKVYEGENIFIFNLENQKIKRYFDTKILEKETKVRLVSGNDVKYALPVEERGAKIEGDFLILPAGFDVTRPYNVKFTDNFQKNKRAYSGEVQMVYKDKEVGSTNGSGDSVHTGNRNENPEMVIGTSRNNQASGNVADTGDCSYIADVFLWLLSLSLTAVVVLLRKRDNLLSR